MGLRRLRGRTSAFYYIHLEKWRGSLLLLPLCLYFVYSRGEYTFVDAADLVIHEAGHAFFRAFGRFMAYAGGTIMQVLLPSVIAWSFGRQGYRFGVQVSLLWVGQNLINVSVYAADARARNLPLLGGDAGEHDWWNLLRMTGLLEYDQAVGMVFFGLAVVVFLALLLVTPRMRV